MVEYVYKYLYVSEYNFNTAADEKPGKCPYVNRAAKSYPRQKLINHKCSGDRSCSRVLLISNYLFQLKINLITSFAVNFITTENQISICML